jgi:deazaflavin-dependent oxidoreductase (nitroreductase family)
MGAPMGPNVLLTVRGRKSGEPRSAGVALTEIDDRRFIIGAYGEVHWVRNLRAAGEGTIRVRGRDEVVRAVELTGADAHAFFRDVLAPWVRASSLPRRWASRIFLGDVVGYPDAAREMTSVHGRKVTGGSFPAEIWARFMKAALSGTSESDFAKPAEGLTEETVCLDTGLLATQNCPTTGDGLFLSDALPKRCTLHREPRLVAVPDVVGMTRGEARTALRGAGFSMEVAGSGETSGQVVSQTPKAGTKAKQGSSVTVEFGTSGGNGGGSDEGTAPGSKVSASFLVEPAGGLTVAFDASGSSGTAPLRYEWDFGDGGTATGVTASHAFSRKGEHSVTLRVTDGAGATSSSTQRVLVK